VNKTFLFSFSIKALFYKQKLTFCIFLKTT